MAEHDKAKAERPEQKADAGSVADPKPAPDGKPAARTRPEAKQEPKPEAADAKPDAQRADPKRLEVYKVDESQRADEQLLARSEISIWIDTYDDIFSDFDPRPFNQRALSVDFLDEARRAAREKKDGQLTLRFLVPAAARNTSLENTIRKRLKEHFSKHAVQKRAEQRAVVRKGALFCVAGGVILAAATLVSYYAAESLLKDFLIVLLEPAGWFTVWNGGDIIFFKPSELRPELDFYERMGAADLRFESY